MPACFLLMFYAWTSQKYLLVMMFMALINYMGALWVEHFRNSTDTLYAYEPFSTNELKMINNENDFVDYNIITDYNIAITSTRDRIDELKKISK